jgi:hypothetical protein
MTSPLVGNPNESLSMKTASPIGSKLDLSLAGNNRNTSLFSKAEEFPAIPTSTHLRIMWQVAVTSAIEGQGESYEIFARLLYQHLTNTGPSIQLHDDTPASHD